MQTTQRGLETCWNHCFVVSVVGVGIVVVVAAVKALLVAVTAAVVVASAGALLSANHLTFDLFCALSAALVLPLDMTLFSAGVPRAMDRCV